MRVAKGDAARVSWAWVDQASRVGKAGSELRYPAQATHVSRVREPQLPSTVAASADEIGMLRTQKEEELPLQYQSPSA
jgi:hypothetical protein